ncbi:MAG: translation initiation factor IF-6 [Candidatus Lokiarchaeota archaeon]|nr:translation initiation factor IF-6 [Candidatus Lokiarchaeota archaeon]
MLERLDAFGSNTVGISLLATDTYCIAPGGTKSKVKERLEAVLKVPCIEVDASFKRLVGVMMVGNSRGLLLPNHISPNDEETIVKAMDQVGGIKVLVLEQSKLNALGNLISTNDKGAVASSKLTPESIEAIEGVLGVRSMQARINNSPLVGTKLVSNAKGCLVSPLATNEEAESFKRILGVENADFTTVCLGMESIRVGMVANSHGALVGNSTSGPEMARISDVLEV